MAVRGKSREGVASRTEGALGFPAAGCSFLGADTA